MLCPIDKVHKKPDRGEQIEASNTGNRGPRRCRPPPATLPVRYKANCDDDGGRREATIYLDGHRAIVKTRSAIGAPLTVCLPISAFDGIAVRMKPAGDAGEIEVVVELRHRDPALCLPLGVADDPADIADAWQMWGERLDLPLLLVDVDGRTMTVDSPETPTARPRRRRPFLADRRPRFLVRRKTGRVGPVERLAAREIIARS
jgi:hypothetical protein